MWEFKIVKNIVPGGDVVHILDPYTKGLLCSPLGYGWTDKNIFPAKEFEPIDEVNCSNCRTIYYFLIHSGRGLK